MKRALKRLFGFRKHEPANVNVNADPVATIYRGSIGELQVTRDGDVARVLYEKDGEFDYDIYKRIQTEGNKLKINWVAVQEGNIRYISAYVQTRVPAVRLILCHGTRNGAEQRFFRSHFGDAVQIIGTEISDTATQFPDTIEWDFHNVKPEWVGAADVIYSNSWDHSYDPEMAFRRWASCLSEHGVMLIEHGQWHTAEGVTALDPFGTSLSGLVELLNRAGEGQFGVVDVLEDLPSRPLKETVVVVARLPQKDAGTSA